MPPAHTRFGAASALDRKTSPAAVVAPDINGVNKIDLVLQACLGLVRLTPDPMGRLSTTDSIKLDVR